MSQWTHRAGINIDFRYIAIIRCYNNCNNENFKLWSEDNPHSDYQQVTIKQLVQLVSEWW